MEVTKISEDFVSETSNKEDIDKLCKDSDLLSEKLRDPED